MRRLLLAVLWALAVAVPAQAQGPLERAREELGIERPLPARWPLPNGDLEVGPSEVLATATTTIRFTVRLERPEPGGSLTVRLPGTERGRSGLRGLRGPERLEIPFAGDGLVHTARVEHVGLAAGTYELPLTWHDGRTAGRAKLRVLAPARERAERPGEDWRGVDVSADAEDQSEAFSTIVPGDPQRIATSANPTFSEPTLSTWLSTDGGATWARHPLPETLDAPGAGVPEATEVCCDPILTATPGGDVWAGGVTYSDGPPGARSRVVVNRLTEGRDGFAPLSVGLPVRTAAMQDKPMMAAAPDGRLLVVWLEPSAADPGALHVVLSACHTALGPESDPGSWCEDADHWTAPIAVTPAPGSYTYPDVAAAPDGAVHVVWWDYSAMENGVRGATCAAPCTGAFAPPRTIALLDSTGGRPLPFGCPIPVAPGGRAGAAPSVEVDGDGRAWVAWADLRPGSGSTRCEETASGYTPPRQTHLSWDAFAAAGDGALPGGEDASAAVGTPVLTDGDEGQAGSSDDFLPWLAVDPEYDEAWASAYSTGHDAQRLSAHYVVVSLAAGPDGRLRVGPANRVSVAPSDFAGEECCLFGNDFGDYAGLAVADRVVAPAWIDNGTGGDADLWAAAGPLATVGFDLVSVAVAEGSGDGDGIVQLGETITLRVVVRNTGTRTAAGFTTPGPAGKLEGPAVLSGSAVWPALAPGDEAAPGEAFELVVADCDRPLEARLTVSSPEGTETLPLSIPPRCGSDPSVPEPTPTPTPSPTPTPEPTPQPASLTRFEVVPGQRLRTVLRRGLLVTAACTPGCRTKVTADISRTTARRLRLRRRIAYATATFGPGPRRVRLPVGARARRLLQRRSSAQLRVRAHVGGRWTTRVVTVRR